MTIYRNFDNISADFTACIGFFDGVHAGHRFLLRHLNEVAHSHGRQSAVITFANHPRKVVQPDLDLKLIDSLDEKLDKLAGTGVDACFLLEFTEEVRQMTAEQFIAFMSDKFRVRELLIGYDHRFGRNRAEGFDDYVRYGHDCGMVIVQEPVFSGIDGAEMNFSSSEVRRNLAVGNVAAARNLLGAYYTVVGTVVAGNQLGRTIGFPTANIRLSYVDKILPASGVYAVLARLDDGSVYPAMLNIGVRPTVDNTNKITLEVHLIGFKGNLYDERIVISFVDRIRDERKMSSIEELRQQLEKDFQTTKDLLSINP